MERPMIGVLLDGSVLIDGGDGSHSFTPAAAALLRRLQYSKLRVGFFVQEYISPQKAIFLRTAAANHSFDCISTNASPLSNSVISSLQSWRDTEEICFYVSAREDEELFSALESQSWKIILINAHSNLTNEKDFLSVGKLEEVPLAVCNSTKMAKQDESFLTIGYIMKASREEDFAKRGAFPMHPTHNGLMFAPLTFDLPLTNQLERLDGILHKATDEIISVDLHTSDISKGILFSEGMHELERCIECHPDCCVIDPLHNIYPLLDRVMIQKILLDLGNLNPKSSNRIRAPHFLKVDNFQQLNLKNQLLQAKLIFPVIVKPQVACGVADAHSMALVFKQEDFKNLSVPLPAVVQEFVDHSSLIFKVYVLGNKVFHAVKKSIPNANALLSSSQDSTASPIIFNSLKSLPIAKENQHPTSGKDANRQSLDEELVYNTACLLREKLKLTIFGFDVVIQEGSRDHVIVDVNYLPSFKEVPDDIAVPAFWAAIKSTCEALRLKKSVRGFSTLL